MTLSQHLWATVKLALPLVGAHLASAAIGATDTAMLGWYGADALAAITIAGTFYFAVYILGTGFSWAVLPRVAAAVAIGDATAVRRNTRMGLWLGVIYAIVSYPLFWYSETLLLRIGQAPEIASAAQEYLRIAGFGLVPGMVLAGLRSTLSGFERTGVVFWATLSGVLVNIAGNYVLIFGNFGAPELGLTGAAISSVLIHLVMALCLLIYTAKTLPEYAFFERFWRPDWEAFWSLFHLGWPISLTLGAEVGIFSAAAFMMGWLGVVATSAHGIAITIASLTFMVHLGLASAATVRIGAAFGRGDDVGVEQAALASAILSGVFVTVTIALFLMVPHWLVVVFIDPNDPQFSAVLPIAISLLALAALFQLFDAAQVLALGFLRGLQDTEVPMIYAWIGYWGIGVPAAFGLGISAGWGPEGIWAGLVIGLMVSGILLAARFLRAQRRLARGR